MIPLPFTLPSPLAIAAIAVVVAGLGGYVKGCSDEAARFATFRANVEAVAKAAEERRAQRIKDQKRIDQEVVRALERDKIRLAHDNAVLLDGLRQHARRSVLPPDAPPPAGDRAGGGAGIPAGVACFSREHFDAGVGAALSALLERAAAGARRGDAAILGLTACVEWAKRQGSLAP